MGNQVQNAVDYLKVIGALDEHENLTVLGRHLSVLPVEPKLGKMLILGTIFNCLDPIMTVVAESAKAQFSARDCSDHIALVRAYNGWKDAERQQSGHEYCWKNFLSAQTLKAIDSLRKQFFSLLKDTGLVDKPSEIAIQGALMSILCEQSSVLNKEKSITLKTMEDGQGLLYSDGHLKMLGGYLDFFMKPTLGDMYLSLKRELEELIQNKVTSRSQVGYTVPQRASDGNKIAGFFNGLDFVGQPCSSKKLAEKDAAAAALLWLKGGTQYSRNTDSSVLLKKSKTINQNRIPVRDGEMSALTASGIFDSPLVCWFIITQVVFNICNTLLEQPKEP
uniref:RNA helicase n=1 Tax=Salix viminalis TaxID=40686 RepID=A0A6N2LUS7_SALVM